MLCNFSCEQNSVMYSHSNETFQVITFKTMADPGEGTGGPGLSPLFLDQTEAQRAEKLFFGDWPPRLSKGLDKSPLTPTPTTSISGSGFGTAKNMPPLQNNILYFLVGLSWK